jgi:UDP-3-O-acyl-N-acetylglucosamine deacetylase
MDGSSAPFIHGLLRAGLAPQAAPATFVQVMRLVTPITH